MESLLSAYTTTDGKNYSAGSVPPAAGQGHESNAVNQGPHSRLLESILTSMIKPLMQEVILHWQIGNVEVRISPLYPAYMYACVCVCMLRYLEAVVVVVLPASHFKIVFPRSLASFLTRFPISSIIQSSQVLYLSTVSALISLMALQQTSLSVSSSLLAFEMRSYCGLAWPYAKTGKLLRCVCVCLSLLLRVTTK